MSELALVSNYQLQAPVCLVQIGSVVPSHVTLFKCFLQSYYFAMCRVGYRVDGWMVGLMHLDWGGRGYVLF